MLDCSYCMNVCAQCPAINWRPPIHSEYPPHTQCSWDRPWNQSDPDQDKAVNENECVFNYVWLSCIHFTHLFFLSLIWMDGWMDVYVVCHCSCGYETHLLMDTLRPTCLSKPPLLRVRKPSRKKKRVRERWQLSRWYRLTVRVLKTKHFTGFFLTNKNKTKTCTQSFSARPLCRGCFGRFTLEVLTRKSQLALHSGTASELVNLATRTQRRLLFSSRKTDK